MHKIRDTTDKKKKLKQQIIEKTSCGETNWQIQAHCCVHLSERKHCILLHKVNCLWGYLVLLFVGIRLNYKCNAKFTCTIGPCRHAHTHTHTATKNPHRMHTNAAQEWKSVQDSAVYCPPMVQFVVIFLRFGLCRNNSSSLLVGSHVVYFSPMPVNTKIHKHNGSETSSGLALKASSLTEYKTIYLAISRLFSAPLWQSAPCLCRICSPDTQNNIFHRIISLLLQTERREEEGERD